MRQGYQGTNVEWRSLNLFEDFGATRLRAHFLLLSRQLHVGRVGQDMISRYGVLGLTMVVATIMMGLVSMTMTCRCFLGNDCQ